MGTATRKAAARETKRQGLAKDVSTEARKWKQNLASSWTRRGGNPGMFDRKLSVGDTTTMKAGANVKHLRGVLFTL